MTWVEETPSDLRPSSVICVEFEQCTTLVVLATPAVLDHL